MIKSILLPVDLNDESSWRKALPQAVDLVRFYNAKLHVLTVIPDYGMSIVGSYFPKGFSEKAKQETEVALKDFVSENIPDGIDVAYSVLHGAIYKEILAQAEVTNCDLIVLSSHRPEMKDYLLGPNAARIVRHARQSVFVVREG